MEKLKKGDVVAIRVPGKSGIGEIVAVAASGGWAVVLTEGRAIYVSVNDLFIPYRRKE